VDSQASFPIGQRAILAWTQGWPPHLVVGLGLVATAAVGVADYAVARLFGYDFVATGFYLVPIGFVAFVGGTRSGMVIALAAALTETVATYAALVDVTNIWTVPISILLELLVFVAAAYSQGAIRRFVDRERHLSRQDAVSGLVNSLGFREAAGWEVARARRFPQVVSLIYLDVDDFKAVNDQQGHARGDEVLRIVGRAMKASLRERRGRASGRRRVCRADARHRRGGLPGRHSPRPSRHRERPREGRFRRDGEPGRHDLPLGSRNSGRADRGRGRGDVRGEARLEERRPPRLGDDVDPHQSKK
jgi:GGDEF domain-containing protein